MAVAQTAGPPGPVLENTRKNMNNKSENIGNGLKVIGVIVCLGALTLTAGLTGCASGSNRQSASQRLDDNSLAEQVREALSADREYKFNDVQVVAYKGDVELKGFVVTRAQKESAGKVARSVGNVQRIENNITVKELN